MELKDLQASVLFSGGSDSTYAAAIAAQRFSKVHLLTFTFRHGYWFDKCKKSVENLIVRFGKDKFVHSFINSDKYIDSIYFKEFGSDLKRHKHYLLISCYCQACKLSMHTGAIIYNLEKGIPYLWEGANHASAHVFADQKKNILNRFQRMYNEFGICFETPVWETDRADRELDKLGLVQKKNQKEEHIIYSGQFTCIVDMPLHFWARFVMDEETHETKASKYFEEKISVARFLVKEELQSRGIYLNEAVDNLKLKLL